MNKTQARKIARSGVTVGEIKAMLIKAWEDGAANDSRSNVNPTFSRALAFNIFWKAFRGQNDDRVVKSIGDVLGATNAIREFGEYWEGYRPTKPKRKKYTGDYHHEEPIDITKDIAKARGDEPEA